MACSQYFKTSLFVADHWTESLFLATFHGNYIVGIRPRACTKSAGRKVGWAWKVMGKKVHKSCLGRVFNFKLGCFVIMELRSLKNVKNCLNTNIYFYLETSGGQSSNLHLNDAPFLTPVLIRHLWQLKTVLFLRWCLIRVVLLIAWHRRADSHLELKTRLRFCPVSLNLFMGLILDQPKNLSEKTLCLW